MRVERLLAKTEIFGQTQFRNFAQSLLELFSLMKIFGQKQNILTAMFGQLGWQKQKIGTDRIERSSQIFFGQTQSFEPMHDVGGEEEQLKEGHVGFPGIAGDFGERIIVKEL